MNRAIGVLAAAMTIPTLAIAGAPMPPDQALALVDRYIAAHNRHDVDAAMAFYADDAIFRLNGGRPPVHGKAEIRKLEAFDEVARSNVSPQGLRAQTRGDDTVVSLAAVREHGLIFGAMGLETVTAKAADPAFVIRDGLFVELVQPEFNPVCLKLMGAAGAGAVAWLAKTGDPREKVLMKDGRLQLNIDTVPVMAEAVADWRRATGWSPDPVQKGLCAAGRTDLRQQSKKRTP